MRGKPAQAWQEQYDELKAMRSGLRLLWEEYRSMLQNHMRFAEQIRALWRSAKEEMGIIREEYRLFKSMVDDDEDDEVDIDDIE